MAHCFQRRRASLLVAAGLAALFAAPGPALAQRMVRQKTVVTVAFRSKVTNISPLNVEPGRRDPGGNTYVKGTVTTTANAKYALQARLSRVYENQVYARNSNGAYNILLSSSSWITVASGPPGKNRVNAVNYLVVWGRGVARNPAAAERIPVTYRLVAGP